MIADGTAFVKRKSGSLHEEKILFIIRTGISLLYTHRRFIAVYLLTNRPCGIIFTSRYIPERFSTVHFRTRLHTPERVPELFLSRLARTFEKVYNTFPNRKPFVPRYKTVCTAL